MLGVQSRVILAKVGGGRPARGTETSGPASPDFLTGNSPRAALQQKLLQPQACKATGYKALNTDSELNAGKTGNKCSGCGA